MGKKKEQLNWLTSMTSSPKKKGTVASTAVLPKQLEDALDDDGFIMLTPTKKGLAKLEKSRNSGKKKFTPIRPVIQVNTDYDLDKVTDQLNAALEAIKKGKYTKAYNAVDAYDVADLVDHYLLYSTGPAPDDISDVIEKLLRVSKSFYEYDNKQRLVIDNDSYDAVLLKWRADGREEPTGLVSNGSKKTQIKYPRLHNNMDKCYILQAGDKVPDGVKETTSVEEFLTKVYKTLGLTPGDKLKLELSPKIDGVSVNGTYKEGRLWDPQTRGDEEASMRIIGLDGIEIGCVNEDEKFTFGIQYEAFLTNEDREEASAYLGVNYKNNRNGVAGLINRLCTSEDDNLLSYISFYPIEVSGTDVDDMRYKDRIEMIQNLAACPDDLPKRVIVNETMPGLLKKINEHMEKLAEIRKDLSFSIDGMVITVVKDDYQNKLGRSGRTNNYQIAYKFNPTTSVGIVKGTSMDFGRKGYRTPQIELEEPVFLDGVKYDHIPVLSMDIFNSLDLHVGDKVRVHRVGDVIPSITVTKHGKGPKLKIDRNCPTCGKLLEVRNKKLYCPNATCASNQVGRIVGLLDALGIDGYSDSFAETLMNQCGVNTTIATDLWNLKPKKLEKAGLSGKIYREFPDKVKEAIRTTPDYKIIGGLGIPDVGASRAKMLIAYHKGVENLVRKMCKDIDSVEFGKALGKVGEKLEKFFKGDGKDFYSWICMDLNELFTLADSPAQNKTRDFTIKYRIGHSGGDLSDEVVKFCRKKDYEIVDGKSFDVLIVSSADLDTGKVKAARKQGKPIYLPEDFMAIYK